MSRSYRHALAVTLLASTGAAVHAAPVVEQSVSGSSGAWVYTYSVTNMLDATNYLYFFGVAVRDSAIISAKVDWNLGGFWDNSDIGGSDRSYNHTWFNLATPILPGQTGYFTVLDNAQAAQMTTAWFTVAYGGIYAGNDYFNSRTNAGFDGIASARSTFVTAPIPEPATWLMMMIGLGAVGYAMRRSRVTFGRYRLS